VARRTNTRNRPQKPASRADGRPGSSYSRRSQIWREQRSRAAAGAPFVRVEVLPSRVGRLGGVPQRYPKPADGADRAARSRTRKVSIAESRSDKQMTRWCDSDGSRGPRIGRVSTFKIPKS